MIDPALQSAPPAVGLSRIVVAIDRSDATRKAIAHAAHLAARFGSELALVHVLEDAGGSPSMDAGDLLAEDLELGRQELVRGSGDPSRVDATVLHGRVARAVVAFAEERGADLIVTGTRDLPGTRRLLSGSVAGEIVRLARGGVLVVPETAHDPAPGQATFEAPLVTVDYGSLSGATLRTASLLSGSDRVDVIHAVAGGQPDGGFESPRARAQALARARDELDRWIRHTLAGSCVHGRARTTAGHVPDAIVDYAIGSGSDLVACGSRDRPLSGSMAEALLDAVMSPVLVVRGCPHAG